MPELAFVAPTSVASVLDELADPGAVLVGGGTSLALLARAGLIEPSRYVSVGGVAELHGIDVVGETLEIGTATTLRELSRDARVQASLPALSYAASKVGNPRVRAVATLGGAICHGDPRQDLPPVLLAAGATLRVASPRGSREIEIATFYTGFMDNLLEDDELVTAVVVPVSLGLRSGYLRFTPNSADDYPTVAAAVSVATDDAGLVRVARLALGGVDATAVLALEAAAALVGGALDHDRIEAAARLAAEHCEPTSDNRGSKEYKRAMIDVILRRSLEALIA
jgi:aerobic carbon-monoxide dehydrogenase medium subunit